MKNTPLTALMLLCGMALSPLSSTAHGQLNCEELLFGNQQNCMHVIDLMMRYGTQRQWMGNSHFFEASPNGPIPVTNEQVGDLVLCSVGLVADETPDSGPIIAVTLQNNSQRDIGGFRVTAVATLGRIVPTSPSQTICIEKVSAGETVTHNICLPIECLGMGIAGGQPLAFNQLVVVADSYDQWIESNETNNWSLVKRCDLVRLLPIVAPVGNIPVETTPVGPNPAGAIPSTIPSGNPESPDTTTAVPSVTPNESIDFDSLQRDTVPVQ